MSRSIDYLLNAGVAGVLILASLGLGGLLLWQLGKSLRCTPATLAALELIAGCGAGGWLLSFGYMIVLSKMVTAVLLLPLAFFALWRLRRLWRRPVWNAGNGPAVALLAVPVVLLVLIAAAPPTAGDVLNYHFDIPQRWVYAGRLFFVSDHQYAGLPSLMHAWYAAALSFGAESAPALLILALQVAACRVIWECTARVFSNGAAWFAVMVYVFSPQAILVSGAAYVDAPLATLVLASVAVLYLGGATGSSLILGGMLLSFAAGVKTNGLLFWPSWGVYSLILGYRQCGFRRTLGYSLLAALIAFGVAFPMFFRTWCWTGNPFYPAIPRIWGYFFPEQLRPFGSVIVSGQASANDVLMTWFQLVMAPWRLTGKTAATPVFFMVSPVALALIPAAILTFRRQAFKLAVLLLPILLFFGLTRISGGVESRFYYLPEGLVAILAGGAFCELSRFGWRTRLPALLLLTAAVGLTVSYAALAAWQTMPYHLGKISRNDFLRRYTSFFNAYELIMKLTPQDAVIGVTSGNSFHLKRRQVRLSRATDFRDYQFTSADDWRKAFGRHHCDYVLLNCFEFENRICAPFPLKDYLAREAVLLEIIPTAQQGRWGQFSGKTPNEFRLYQMKND